MERERRCDGGGLDRGQKMARAMAGDGGGAGGGVVWCGWAVVTKRMVEDDAVEYGEKFWVIILTFIS